MIFFHNPRCSKSRQALELIRTRGIEPEIVEYLKTPPDGEKITQILKALNLPARELLRKGEPLYKELGLQDPLIPDAVLIEAMAQNPILIERPIALMGDRAAIGRPPEKVLTLLP